MKKNLLRSSATFLFSISALLSSAQDTWTPSEKTGFGNFNNHSVKALLPFKGKLYAGSADNIAKIYSTSSGIQNSWSQVFTDTNITSINALTSVADGGGYMYAAAYAPFGTIGSIYKTADGSTWSLYHTSVNTIKNIIPFKGLGTVDSIYSIENGSFGDIIKRSAYNSNDPLDTLLNWDTVLNFGSVNAYAQVNAAIVHNGRMFLGTSSGGTLYSSPDGTTWTPNYTLDSSFTNSYNYAINALGSYSGYLYAATYNYNSGTEIWRTNDYVNWVMVAQFSSYNRVTSFITVGTELWASMTPISNGSGQIVKSADGITFVVSENNGFGLSNNNGRYGNFAVFGNNLYYGSENYGYSTPALASGRGIGYSTGAQIWRKCTVIAPSISVGADQTVCTGVPAYFNASPGFTSYVWDDGTTTQQLTTNLAGDHYVIATDINGCDATDTAHLTTTPSPDMLLGIPVNSTVCHGDSISVTGSANSNLRITLPPISKTTNDSISNYIGITYDTLAVTGITECACTSLYSVTIDSLYHTNVGDLAIGLYSPSGSFINLESYAYGSNFTGTEFIMNAPGLLGNTGYAPYNGQFLPINPFSNLTGSPTGNWVLQINDNYVTDNGNLKGWTLKFTVADSILTYSWSPSAGVSMSMSLNTMITPSSTGSYFVTTTNSIGCSVRDTVTFFVPSITASTTNDSLCYGMSTMLLTDGTINSMWSPTGTLSSSTGTSVIATPSVSTMYYVTDIIAGCVASDSISITVDSPMTISATASKSICFGDSTSLNASVMAGTAPYTYLWSGGSTSSASAYVPIGPSASTLYTFYATDAFGCTQTDSTNITVAPSTDIYGHVGYSAGNVAGSNVLLYKYYSYQTHFDTVQITTTDASGNYHFPSVGHMYYIIKVFPAASYTSLVPTYYGNTFLWDSASIVYHYCALNDTLNIISVEDAIATTGPGYLHGTIVEDTGYVRVPGDPIPGVDVKLGRNPGGQLMSSTITDTTGSYSFSNVAYGNYTVYADIPGLGRDSSYTFTVDSANSIYNYLNYTVDSSEVHYVPNAGVGIHNIAIAENKFSVYPNPSKGNATIEYTISVNSDVKLGIYNMLGVEIAKISDTRQQAGTYTYSMEEKKNNLSPGVYFVTLITNGKTFIHKIIITE